MVLSLNIMDGQTSLLCRGILILDLSVIYLLKTNFFKKINFKKVNYFLIFSSVIKNKLENTFQCLVMSCKINWNITY